MKMKTQRTITLTLILAAAIVVAWWHSTQRLSSSQDFPPVTADIDPETSTEAALGATNSAARNLAKSATTGREIPDNEGVAQAPAQPDDTIGRPSEYTFVDQIQDVLDRKELAFAYPAFVVITQCRTTSTSDENWERRRQHIERRLESGDFPRGEELLYEFMLIEPEQKLADCQALRELKQDSLDTSLRRRANNGDAYARFLYAVWPPYEDDSLDATIESMVEYESTALEFTLINLEEGHPLGLLALGLSYGSGLFTAHRWGLGASLVLAAQACSSGAFQTEHIVEMYMRYLEVPLSNQPTEEEVLAAGVRLYDQHCATSIANSPP